MIKALLTKELLLIFRDSYALLALFVMPMLFVLIMSLALKDVFNKESAAITYAIVDNDKTRYSKDYVMLLAKSKKFEQLSEHTSNEAMFTVTIPEGFSQNFSFSQGNQGVAHKLIVTSDAALAQQTSVLFQSFLATMYLKEMLDLIYKSRFRDSSTAVDNATIEDLITTQYKNKASRPNSTQQSVPAWLVFGMFFVMLPLSTIFIQEKKQHMLERLAAMNVSIDKMMAAKVIPYFIINQLQFVLMLCMGIFIIPLFGADALQLGSSSVALLLLSFSVSLAAISVAMFIASIAKTIDQASIAGGATNILLGAIGGVMVPVYVMPDVMQSISALSPMAWALDGFLDIFLRAKGFSDVWGAMVKLLVFALLFFSAARIIMGIKMRSIA